MQSAARHKHAGTCARFNHVVTHLHAHRAFQHVPRFVIALVNMWRSDQPSFSRGSAGIAPFRDHKIVHAGAECVSRKRRSDDGPCHVLVLRLILKKERRREEDRKFSARLRWDTAGFFPAILLAISQTRPRTSRAARAARRAAPDSTGPP